VNLIPILFLLLLFPVFTSIVFAEIPNSEYKNHAYSIKSSYYDHVEGLRKTISIAEDTLSGLVFENPEAKEKIDTAWSIRWMALTSYDDAKEKLEQTETYLKHGHYRSGYNNLLEIDKNSKSIQEDLEAIIKEVKKGRDLEREYQEQKRICFLFWCTETKDTFSKVDARTPKLESKLKEIENKLSILEDKAFKITQIIYYNEIEKRNQEIQKLENLRSQEQFESEVQERKLQKQIMEEQLEADKQEQKLQQQIEYKEKERIIEQARTNPLLRGLIDGSIQFYIQPIPSYYKVSGINDAIDDVADSLESKNIRGVVFERVYDTSNADITISWIKNYGTSQGGAAIFKSVVQVALGDDQCHNKWQAFDVWTVKKIMWHEIGHSLGYGHSDDYDNIMYPSVGHKRVVDAKETVSLIPGTTNLWYLCTSGDVWWTAKTYRNTDGFDAFAIPRDASKEFPKSGFSAYLDSEGKLCGKRNITSITRYCSVGDGYLAFRNNEEHSFTVTFEMHNNNPGKNPNMHWDKDVFSYSDSYMDKVLLMFHSFGD